MRTIFTNKINGVQNAALKVALIYYFLLREIVKVKSGEKTLCESRESYQKVFNAASEAQSPFKSKVIHGTWNCRESKKIQCQICDIRIAYRLGDGTVIRPAVIGVGSGQRIEII